MMGKMLKRANALAAVRQRRKIRQAADRLGELLGSGSISVEESRLVVSGRGLLKRWLIDPELRFLRANLK